MFEIFETFLTPANLGYYRNLNLKMWIDVQNYYLVPLIILAIVKIFQHKSDSAKHAKNNFAPGVADCLMSVFFSYSVLYFAVDLTLMILQAQYGVCHFAFLLHHLTSTIFLPPFALPYNYPWWQIYVPLFHAVIEKFQNVFVLDMMYLGSIILFHWGVYQKPWTNMIGYRIAKVALLFIYFAVAMMFVFDCRVELYSEPPAI